MGHFSYSCRLSGVPITSGDKAVLIPLIPSGPRYDYSDEKLNKYGTTVYVSNDGENVFFRPFAFPIFGTYDSYGCLEDIEEDDNTKTLEKFFGLTIQDIVNVICSGRKDDGFDDALDVVKTGTKESRGDDYGKPKYQEKYKLLIRASGTWMRREIYDGLAVTKVSDYFDKVDIGVPAILNSLGFKEETPILSSLKKALNSDSERFNRVFKNGPVTLHSDGNWVEVEKGKHVYNLPELKRYCKERGLDIDISNIGAKGYYEQVYDYILPETKSINHGGRWEGDRVRDLFLCERYDAGKMSEFYFNEVKDNGGEFLRKNIIDWHKVKRYFYATGHYLSPVGTSPQDGEPKDVLAVINIAKAVLESDLKDRGYEEELEEEMD